MDLTPQESARTQASSASIERSDRDTDLTSPISHFSLHTKQTHRNIRSGSSPSRATSESGGTWSTSAVWKSFETYEWERFLRLQRWQFRTDSPIKDSPFVPASFQDYVDHRVAFLEDGISRLKSAILAKQQLPRSGRKSNIASLPIFGGKDLSYATQILGKAVPAITVQDILCSRALDSDTVFIANAEELLGEDLLRDL